MDNLKKTIQRKLEPLSIISNALNNDLSDRIEKRK